MVDVFRFCIDNSFVKGGLIEVNDKINRVPTDGYDIDFMTYSFDELNVAYKAYCNALYVVAQAYTDEVHAYDFDFSDPENKQEYKIYDYNGEEIKDPKKKIQRDLRNVKNHHYL